MDDDSRLRTVGIEEQREVPQPPETDVDVYFLSCEQYNPLPGVSAGVMVIGPNGHPRYDDLPFHEVMICIEGEVELTEYDDDGDPLDSYDLRAREFALFYPGLNYSIRSTEGQAVVVWVSADQEQGPYDVANLHGEKYAAALRAFAEKVR